MSCHMPASHIPALRTAPWALRGRGRYGFVSNSRITFIAVVDDDEVKDAEMRTVRCQRVDPCVARSFTSPAILLMHCTAGPPCARFCAALPSAAFVVHRHGLKPLSHPGHGVSERRELPKAARTAGRGGCVNLRAQERSAVSLLKH